MVQIFVAIFNRVKWVVRFSSDGALQELDETSEVADRLRGIVQGSVHGHLLARHVLTPVRLDRGRRVVIGQEDVGTRDGGEREPLDRADPGLAVPV
jgi:hypothetical protein